MSLVTAVITTHKRHPDIVERALKSILSQSYKDIEVIVVDDSPSSFSLRDKVKDMVNTYSEKRVRYVQHETCLGACAARNTGLSLANGEFISYLDDDDEWMPTKIEEQLKAFDAEQVALVYCASMAIYEETGKTIERQTTYFEERTYEKLICKNYIGSTSFPLMRTKCLRDVDGFDIEMQSAQDYDVWLRIAKQFSVRCVNKPLVLYHFHSGEQITKNPTKKIAGLERINLKNADYIRKNRKVYWYRHTCLIPYYVRNKQRKKALATWLKCCFKCPLKIKGNLTNLYSILLNMKDCKKTTC